MTKVITYGTYDLLHYGHIRLLERARALGDYLVVGITADGFDQQRGKINVQQSLIERIEAVKATGLADEIVVEEYEGQKIDDIRRLDIDIFTVGSDWVGHFDYLKEFCKVVYLDRTQGVSSTEIRSTRRAVRLGVVGESAFLNRFISESRYVNGLEIGGICTENREWIKTDISLIPLITDRYETLLEQVDAVYIISMPGLHFEQIRQALERSVHVLCESPLVLSVQERATLQQLAKDKKCVLMDALRTAYSTAYYRLLLLVKSGVIGEVKSVDSICTSLRNIDTDINSRPNGWNSICSWGPTAMLPIFQILGTNYKAKNITSHLVNRETQYDSFTKCAFVYGNAVASLKVGLGVKSEGELIISGTKGYVYVPAPWWKTDYFEIRYENPTDNRRYFYQLEGEGIRYLLVSFLKAISSGHDHSYISNDVSTGIVKLIEDYYDKNDFMEI